MSRAFAAILLSVALSACKGPAEPPPVPPDPGTLDPQVAALVQQALAGVEQAPRDPARRARLALVYQANGMAVQAVEAWRQALAGDDGNARWWYHLGTAQATLGDYDGALDALGRAAAIEPSHAPLYWRRGFWLLELGRLDEAMTMFTEAERHSRGDAAALIGRARVHLMKNEPDRAVPLLEALLRAYPEAGYIHQLLGNAYQKQGRFPDAAAALSRASGVRPVFNDAWTGDVLKVKSGYGSTMKKVDGLVELGQFDLALACLADLAQLHPGDPVVLSKRGETFLLAGDLTSARDTLEEALRHDPNYHYAHIHLATVWSRQGRTDRALEHVERVLAGNPSLGLAWRIKADLLIERKDWPGAEAALRQAIRVGQTGGDAQIQLATVQFQQRRYSEADATLVAVISRDPRNVRACLALCAMRADRGNLAGAEQALQRADAVAPDDPEVRRLAAELAKRRGGRP